MSELALSASYVMGLRPLEICLLLRVRGSTLVRNNVFIFLSCFFGGHSLKSNRDAI